MRLDSPADARAFSRIYDRLAALETARPQEASSIEYGVTRVLNSAGDAVAAVGHANGRSGLLIPRGGSLVTVQEWTNQTIVEAGAYNDARITGLEGRTSGLEGRMGTAEGSLTYAGNRLTDVEGRMGRAEGRLTTNEGSLSYAGARIGDLEGRTGRLEPRMAAAEGDVASLQGWRSNASGQISALQSRDTTLANAINAVADYAAAILDRFDAHMDQYHGGRNPGRPTKPGTA